MPSLSRNQVEEMCVTHVPTKMPVAHFHTHATSKVCWADPGCRLLYSVYLDV